MRRLEVRLRWAPKDEVRVGTIAEDGPRILFEYDADYLRTGSSISPFLLPLDPGVHAAEDRTFEGLHGVFDDSLPDGWGRLLMDRTFARRSVPSHRITPLDRLAYVHDRAMGALTYHPPKHEPDAPREALDLTALAQQAEAFLAGTVEDVLPELELVGGSPGGARPKVLVAIDAEGQRLVSGTLDPPDGYRHFLVKFAAREDAADIGPVEEAYARMARSAGIDLPDTLLLPTRDGRRHFATARFDRDGAQRRHAHTLAGLLHADHRGPTMTYTTLLKATYALTNDYRQMEEAFRRMVFNVLAHNRDDHTKNTSYLMAHDGSWTLAPAYDLVPSTGINGWHATDVAGSDRDPTRDDMLRVAEEAGLRATRAIHVVEEVTRAVRSWRTIARGIAVPDTTIERVAGMHLV